MKLTRREFFKGLAAGAVVIGTPKIIQDAIEVEELWTPNKTISIPKRTIITSDWEIDYATKNIRFIGDKNKGATVLELHRWLQEQSDKAYVEGEDSLCILDSTPSTRVTDQIIKLENNWYVRNPEYLKDGSIEQRGELWMGVKSVGIIDDSTVPFINNVPAIRPGHINQCVKANYGENITVSTKTHGNTYSRFNLSGAMPGVQYAALTETPDLCWDNPKDDPMLEIIKDWNNTYPLPSTTRGMRQALKDKA